jgi:hypothetical protein
MLLLRIGSRGRWAAGLVADDPGNVANAAADLTLKPSEEGLSVFRVEGENEAREAAVRFALTCRRDRRHADYVVFSSDLAERLGLVVARVPREELDSWLSERHHEIFGLTPALALRLAAAILADADRRVGRVPKEDLGPVGAELCRHDRELREYLTSEWAMRLASLLDDPASGG